MLKSLNDFSNIKPPFILKKLTKKQSKDLFPTNKYLIVADINYQFNDSEVFVFSQGLIKKYYIDINEKKYQLITKSHLLIFLIVNFLNIISSINVHRRVNKALQTLEKICKKRKIFVLTKQTSFKKNHRPLIFYFKYKKSKVQGTYKKIGPAKIVTIYSNKRDLIYYTFVLAHEIAHDLEENNLLIQREKLPKNTNFNVKNVKLINKNKELAEKDLKKLIQHDSYHFISERTADTWAFNLLKAYKLVENNQQQYFIRDDNDLINVSPSFDFLKKYINQSDILDYYRNYQELELRKKINSF